METLGFRVGTGTYPLCEEYSTPANHPQGPPRDTDTQFD